MGRNVYGVECTFNAKMTLTESEAEALATLFSYQGGVDGFLAIFYEKMGKAYLQPHEHGIRSLAKTIDREIAPQLGVIRVARHGIEKALAENCRECGGINKRHYVDCPNVKGDKKP